MHVLIENNLVPGVLAALDASPDDAAKQLAIRVREELELDKDPVIGEYRRLAQKHPLLSEGTLEVDDNALVSLGGDDDGAYVMAWLWIKDPNIEEED